MISVLTYYNVPLLFRYCLTTIMTNPSSFCYSSVVLLVEMESSPPQLLFLCLRLLPSLQLSLSVFLSLSLSLSLLLSFPPVLLLFLFAAAAAAAVPLELS